MKPWFNKLTDEERATVTKVLVAEAIAENIAEIVLSNDSDDDDGEVIESPKELAKAIKDATGKLSNIKKHAPAKKREAEERDGEAEDDTSQGGQKKTRTKQGSMTPEQIAKEDHDAILEQAIKTEQQDQDEPVVVHDTIMELTKLDAIVENDDALEKIDWLCSDTAEGLADFTADARKKIQGWRAYMLQQQGISEAGIASKLKVSVSTVSRALAIYNLITKLHRLRFYRGSMDKLRLMAPHLESVAQEKGAIDRWNEHALAVDEHWICKKNSESEETFSILPIRYLLGFPV